MTKLKVAFRYFVNVPKTRYFAYFIVSILYRWFVTTGRLVPCMFCIKIEVYAIVCCIPSNNLWPWSFIFIIHDYTGCFKRNLPTLAERSLYIYYTRLYRMFQKKSAILWQNVSCVDLHRYNQIYMRWVHGGAVGWVTALQARSSRVRFLPIMRSKARVWNRSLAGVASSNLSGGMDAYVACCKYKRRNSKCREIKTKKQVRMMYRVQKNKKSRRGHWDFFIDLTLSATLRSSGLLSL